MRISDWSSDVCSSDLQKRLRALELFKRKTRNLGDDIIDRRLERGGRRAGDVVLDLVQRIADRQLRRDLGDRKAGGLGCKRRRPRDARVHLDNDQPPVLWIDCELYRSEEHTSELQSLMRISYAVFCLKKKKKKTHNRKH